MFLLAWFTGIAFPFYQNQARLFVNLKNIAGKHVENETP
jgi:hypothetical protein